MGSQVYRDAVEWYEKNGEADDLRLFHKAWDMTPWMINTYDGSMVRDTRYRDMIEWCCKRWGDQAWWPAQRPGAWQRGSVTIHGWTDWGFDTEAKMNEFAAAWPVPDGLTSRDGGSDPAPLPPASEPPASDDGKPAYYTCQTRDSEGS